MSCIVVVDDQGTNRRVISKLASTIEDNVAVVEFEDPFDALSFFRNNTPDLVITDYSMPTINGAEFIRRVRGMPKCYDVPVVVVTTHSDPEFRRLALEAGTSEYLSLPLNFEEFRLKSRNLLALRDARRVARVLLDAPALEQGYARQLEHTQARAEFLDGLVETLSRRLVQKIKQLERADGELNAFIDSGSHIAIFIDEELRIRRFTTAAANYFDFQPVDIGRPLVLTNVCLCYCDLGDDLKAVKEHGKVIQRFVELPKTDRVYQARIIPTKCNDGSFSGGIILFNRIQIGLGSRA